LFSHILPFKLLVLKIETNLNFKAYLGIINFKMKKVQNKKLLDLK